MTEHKPGLIRDSKGKRPAFYDNAALDQMMSMIMVLTGEVSVLADHIDSIERVAANNGLNLAEGVAALSLDQTALEAREERRQALLSRLFYMMRKEAKEAAEAETQQSYMEAIAEIAKP